MRSVSNWSSFEVQLDGYDTDEVLSPILEKPRPSMRVKRSNGTVTTPQPPCTANLVAAGEQPRSTQRVTRAASRGATPGPEAATAGPLARKRKQTSAAPSREPTPSALPLSNQENKPSNLRGTRRAASTQPGEGARRAAKRARSTTKSPAPAAAAPAAATAEQATAPASCRQAAAGGGSKRKRGAPQGAAVTQEQQAEAPPCMLTTRPSTNSLMTSMGPQRSESLMDSILKSPSPPRRSTSVVRSQLTFNMQLGGGVVGAALPQLVMLGVVDQPALDQPLPPHQAGDEAEVGPAGAAATAAAGNVLGVQQQQEEGGQQQQPAAAQELAAEAMAVAADAGAGPLAANEEELAAEGRGESPMPEEGPQAGEGGDESPDSPAKEALAPALAPREARLSISPACLPQQAQAALVLAAMAAAVPSQEAAAAAAGLTAVGEGQQQAGRGGTEASPRRTSPRLKRSSSPRNGSGGSAGRAAGSVRFELPPGRQARPKVQRSPAGSPQESQQTAKRSTARQGAGDAPCETPISKQADEAAGAAGGDATWFNPLDPEKVLAAKRAFSKGSGGSSGVPICREREARAIDAFLRQHLAEGSGGSLYVSGLAGAGKSLTVHELVRQLHRSPAGESGASAAAPAGQLPPALITINCKRREDPSQVIGDILGCYYAACARPYPGSEGAEEEDPLVTPAPGQQLQHAQEARSEGCDPLRQLQKLVLSAPAAAAAAAGARGRRKKGGRAAGAAPAGSGEAGVGGPRGMLVVVLDEMDGLLANHCSGCRTAAGAAKKARKASSSSSSQSPLLDLLVLAHQKRSRLLLVGIANDLNLVHKVMPDVLAHPSAPAGMQPLHVPFPPYQRAQVARLIQQRLATLPGPCFDPKAVEMCARKMSNGNGDMRLVLETCCQALDLLAEEARAAAAKAAETAACKTAEAAAGTAAAGAEAPSGKQGLCPAEVGPSTAAAGAAAAARSSAPAGPRLLGLRQMGAALNKLTGGIGANNHFVQMVRGLAPQQQLIMCAVAKLLGESMGDRGAPLPRAALAIAATPATGAKKGKSRALFMSPANSGRSGSSSLATGGSSALAAGARNRDISLGQLYEVFVLLSQQVGYRECWDRTTFYSVCDNLDSLLAISKGANPSARRVSMKCHEDDVVMGVADTPQVRNVVSG